MPKLIDLTGKRFGRLVVVEFAGKNKWGNVKWLCLCDCKNKAIVISSNLRKGDTKSCGCLLKDIAEKHGHSKRGK